MNRSDASKRRPRRGLLVRGESLIASAGLTLASLLLLAMGAIAYWNTHFQHQAREAARGNQVQAIGRTVADSVTALLEADQLTAVRRLVAETARGNDLTMCRLALGDGRVIAHSNPSQIALEVLPERWSDEKVEAVTVTTTGSISLAYPITIAGRGTARLEMTAPIPRVASRYWETNAGVALFGAAAMLGLLLVYRRVRARVGALGVIRDALMDLDRGERSPSVLSVPEHLGAAALAWNRLLEHLHEAEEQLLDKQIGSLLATGRDGASALDGACDVLPHGLILVDRNGKVAYLNGSAAVYLRADREVAIGADLEGIIDDSKVIETLDSVVERSMRCWTSVEVIPAGQECAGVLRFGIRPLRGDNGKSAVIVIEDITQQRVPLTNIRLYIEHAMEDGETHPKTRSALNVINQETKRLERVVGDMLSVAEIEAGKYEIRSDDVRLDGLFEDLDHDYRSSASEKRITLQFDLPPKLPVIHADRDKISMALHNLIGNAIKYTPADGRVEVRVRADGELLVVEVVDNGIGIKEEELDRVFEKFYRADDGRVSEITGSGLGLALAREVVRMHGGDITARSQLDKGSTFTMSVPAVRKAAA
jgi:signal transduction histidine kinase